MAFALRLDGFAPSAHGVRVQDQEAEGLVDVGKKCPASRCAIVSIDDSKKFWYHDPASLARWYSSGARIVPWASAANAGVIRAHDSIYWVGSGIPPAVRSLGTYVTSYGTWEVYRSTPGVTKEILTASHS